MKINANYPPTSAISAEVPTSADEKIIKGTLPVKIENLIVDELSKFDIVGQLTYSPDPQYTSRNWALGRILQPLRATNNGVEIHVQHEKGTTAYKVEISCKKMKPDKLLSLLNAPVAQIDTVSSNESEQVGSIANFVDEESQKLWQDSRAESALVTVLLEELLRGNKEGLILQEFEILVELVYEAYTKRGPSPNALKTAKEVLVSSQLIEQQGDLYRLGTRGRKVASRAVRSFLLDEGIQKEFGPTIQALRKNAEAIKAKQAAAEALERSEQRHRTAEEELKKLEQQLKLQREEVATRAKEAVNAEAFYVSLPTVEEPDISTDILLKHLDPDGARLILKSLVS